MKAAPQGPNQSHPCNAAGNTGTFPYLASEFQDHPQHVYPMRAQEGGPLLFCVGTELPASKL